MVCHALEILRQLPGLSGHRKTDVTMDELELHVRAQTDTATAMERPKAQRRLFASFRLRRAHERPTAAPPVGGHRGLRKIKPERSPVNFLLLLASLLVLAVAVLTGVRTLAAP
jgi:hypothetical protein